MTEHEKIKVQLNERIVLAGIALNCLQRRTRIIVDHLEQDPDDPEASKCSIPDDDPKFKAWADETYITLEEVIKEGDHPPIDDDKREPEGMQALCMMFVFGFCEQFMTKHAVRFAARETMGLGEVNADALLQTLQKAMGKEGRGMRVIPAKMDENGNIVPIAEEDPFKDVPELDDKPTLMLAPPPRNG